METPVAFININLRQLSNCSLFNHNWEDTNGEAEIHTATLSRFPCGFVEQKKIYLLSMCCDDKIKDS